MRARSLGRLILGLQVAIPAFCVVFANPGRAQEEPDYSRSGLYVGVGVGVASDMALEDEIKDVLEALGYGWIDVDVKESVAIQGRLGYRVAPHLATELQLEYGAKFKGEASGVEVWTHKLLAFTANAKVPVLCGRFQPYALAGAGFLHGRLEDELGLGVSLDDTDFALRFGGGLDLYATEDVSVGLDLSYVLPFNDVEDLDYLSFLVGLQYRF